LVTGKVPVKRIHLCVFVQHSCTQHNTNLHLVQSSCRCFAPAGQIDAYYQFMLKPYDVAAGIVILEEAGGRVTTADGSAYSVFDRSLLATNDALYEQVCHPSGRMVC
jgi:3'-phosphoadenosine 5'-phosphosulfate (PAPS) 3'-phosphatase